MFWRFFHKMMDLSPILVAVFMGKLGDTPLSQDYRSHTVLGTSMDYPT
jgi:hypothetical protein